MLSAPKAINSILQNLNPRQKEVVIGRFGLAGAQAGLKDGETLAAIGDRLGVTRERVRQIEKSALQTLSKQVEKNPSCLQILSLCKKYLKNGGGVMKKDLLLNHAASFAEGLHENHLALLVEASGAFHLHPEDDNFLPFYYLGKSELKAAVSFTDKWVDFLESRKADVLSGLYQTKLTSFIKTNQVPRGVAENFLDILKKIHRSPYGDLGLRDWPEIRPTTTRDRAYLVLKKKNRPLHFTAIAETINQDRLGGAQTALAPTVHNELIKDPRFVLVGRGIYALREQGYEPGIARVVIQKILKRQGPLTHKELIVHVQKQRFFKPNTILINLQNKNFFERHSDGTYKVREA